MKTILLSVLCLCLVGCPLTRKVKYFMHPVDDAARIEMEYEIRLLLGQGWRISNNAHGGATVLYRYE